MTITNEIESYHLLTLTPESDCLGGDPRGFTGLFGFKAGNNQPCYIYNKVDLHLDLKPAMN